YRLSQFEEKDTLILIDGKIGPIFHYKSIFAPTITTTPPNLPRLPLNLGELKTSSLILVITISLLHSITICYFFLYFSSFLFFSSLYT
ncbi:hypothetical protein J7L48_01065, partial [bacterium]|nr:hypothetical protein [bacterium]